ncbi:MAG: His/Gly/Thr/Pro-type tRNA ligase C-terminal domain-containing protein, partial [Gammaproteobacteria bacterium]
ANCGGGGFKAQFRRADKSGARIAVILGADEVRQGVAGVKLMYETSEQESVGQGDLAGHIKRMLGGRVLGRSLKEPA